MPFLLPLINALGLTTPQGLLLEGVGLQTKGAAPPSRPLPPQSSSGPAAAGVTRPVSSTPSPALASCPHPGWPCPGHRSSSGPPNPCSGAVPAAGAALRLRERVPHLCVSIVVKVHRMKFTLPAAFFKCVCGRPSVWLPHPGTLVAAREIKPRPLALGVWSLSPWTPGKYSPDRF